MFPLVSLTPPLKRALLPAGTSIALQDMQVSIRNLPLRRHERPAANTRLMDPSMICSY
jgi:hypothetical protein